MKTTCLVLVACVGSLCLAEDAIDGGPEPKPLEKRDPYSIRAGAFYEKSYLPGAIKGLQAVFAPQELSDEKAKEMLLELVYGFLGQLHKEGGEISRRGHARVLARLDKEVAALADDPKVLKNYEAWKGGGSKEFRNPLQFLTRIEFQARPMRLKLNAELKEHGWSVESLESLTATGDYGDRFGVEPYQVLKVLRREKEGAKSLRLLILVYRLRDSAKVFRTMDARQARAGRDPADKATLFWRTDRHVAVLVENRGPGNDHVKEWIKRQWTDATRTYADR